MRFKILNDSKLISWIREKVDFRFLFNIVILLLIQFVTKHDLLIQGRFEWYFQDMFSLNLLRIRLVQILAVLVLALLILNYVRISYNRWLYQWSWSAFEHSKGLRLFVMIAVVVMTWAFACYGYNYYYNQPHYLDRLLLIVLAVLVYFNPLFLLPFVIIVYVISYQFRFPVPYSYTDKQVLFEFMSLFVIFVIVRPFTRGRTMDFIFLSLCMIASFYYYPGIEKIVIGNNQPINWLFDNNLQNYVPFTYEKGWLAFRSQELVYTIADFVRTFRVPLQLFTLIAELGALFIIAVQRRGAIAILWMVILLHTGIMLTTGIFFWKWIALDAGMAWFIWRYGKHEAIAPIFRPIPVALSVIIIVYGARFYEVHRLGWWNSPIHTYYKFDVIDTQGDVYDFAYSQLQPYDFVLTQNRLHFINRSKTVTGTAGETRLTDLYIDSLGLTLADVPDFIEEYGTVSYDSEKAELLRDLLRVYAYNFNTNHQSFFLPSIIQPPLHIMSQPFADVYNFKYPIAEVEIHAIVSFYDGHTLHIISDEITDSLPITVPEHLLNDD